MLIMWAGTFYLNLFLPEIKGRIRFNLDGFKGHGSKGQKKSKNDDCLHSEFRILNSEF